ncbi:MAG: CpsD/CapB family tyrosine-protein kinase [Anaerolineae bacterium]|nr:CpsD/CapB family tyrosine-protein kinase [Anaerolineae bacterium]
MDKQNLITLSEPRSPASEAYRALRMNLEFTSLDKSLESFVVSSPGTESHKSLVAANLAVVIAQSGQHVILVDADLRRPNLHQLFALPQEPGVTTYMLGRDVEADLPLLDTDITGLRLLPSGALPPNPADILGSQKMQQLLARLQNEGDVVILDAPPVTVAIDASVVAAHTDGIVLVVRAGHTRRDRVDQAKELLERFRVKILGAVLTDAKEQGLLTGY